MAGLNSGSRSGAFLVQTDADDVNSISWQVDDSVQAHLRSGYSYEVYSDQEISTAVFSLTNVSAGGHYIEGRPSDLESEASAAVLPFQVQNLQIVYVQPIVFEKDDRGEPAISDEQLSDDAAFVNTEWGQSCLYLDFLPKLVVHSTEGLIGNSIDLQGSWNGEVYDHNGHPVSVNPVSGRMKLWPEDGALGAIESMFDGSKGDTAFQGHKYIEVYYRDYFPDWGAAQLITVGETGKLKVDTPGPHGTTITTFIPQGIVMPCSTSVPPDLTEMAGYSESSTYTCRDDFRRHSLSHELGHSLGLDDSLNGKADIYPPYAGGHATIDRSLLF